MISFLLTPFFILLILFSTLVFAEIPPDVKPAMDAGYAAANKGDFLEAIQHFNKALEIAPNSVEIYYNLALAESKIPGREFRAVALFGIYLYYTPDSPKASVIKEQMKELDQAGLKRFFAIMEEAAKQINSDDYKNWTLKSVATLQVASGNDSEALRVAALIKSEKINSDTLREISLAQLNRGDILIALKTAELIPWENDRGSAQGSVAENLAKSGDITTALQLTDKIDDLFWKSYTKAKVAHEQLKKSDKPGALKTLEDAKSLAMTILHSGFKAWAKREVSLQLALTGSIDDALNLTKSIEYNEQDQSDSYEQIAEVQAKMGNIDAAHQTLALALEVIKKTEGAYQPVKLDKYNEAKARIDGGTAGNQWNDAPTKTPDSSSDSPYIGWYDVLQDPLNAEAFIDLKNYLAKLSINSPSEIYYEFKGTAEKMVDAHNKMAKLLKELETQQGPKGN